MQEVVLNLLEKYLEGRSQESFLRLREAVAASPDYKPYDNSPEIVLSTIEKGNYEQARTALLALMGAWFLNPGIHIMLAFMHHKLGDERGANMESTLGG